MEEGIVYVLKNPAFPNLIKIGITLRDEVQIRMSELYSTGVPFPFECVYAGKVKDAKKVERSLHQAFNPNRVNPSREFFDIDESQAIVILKLLDIEDVTPEINQELDKVDEGSKEASKEYSRTRRPSFNFLEMGIQVGEILYATDGKNSCEVVDEKKVRYNDEIVSLTRATRLMLDSDYNVAPGLYWNYKGKRLRTIYNETYEYED
jgi:hypothetical protein